MKGDGGGGCVMGRVEQGEVSRPYWERGRLVDTHGDGWCALCRRGRRRDETRRLSGGSWGWGGEFVVGDLEIRQPAGKSV